MDRTSRIAIFACAIFLIGLEFAMQHFYPTPPPKPKPAVVAPAGASATNAASATPPLTPGTPALATAVLATPAPVEVPEQVAVLENPAIKVTLTSHGAAIKTVELKQHKEEAGHILLNQQAHSSVLQLSGWQGTDITSFQIKESTPDRLVYAADLPGGVKWERSYVFGHDQDTQSGMSGFLRKMFLKFARYLGDKNATDVPLIYHLDVKDSLSNPGGADVTLPAYSLSVGRAEPIYVHGKYDGGPYAYPGSGWYTGKYHLTTVNDFNPGSFLWIPTHPGKDIINSTSIDDAPLRWLGSENQFYAVLLTPSSDRIIQHAVFQCFNQRNEEGHVPPGVAPDIEAAAFFPAVTVPAGKTVDLNYSVYAGPKEFNRLDALGDDQGELMNYGWFVILIVPMLTILKFWYLIFHNYGVAIILLTLIIKAITWPLQSIANHSGKRMQALAPKLKELQAKYKDKPEKLQAETFGMYRDYGVNPFGGCLPALIQMPVFFSLYFMLQNAVELRGQSFLWVHDLTQPDNLTSFVFLGTHISVNVLPILVTGLTVVMMKMTPQIGDPQQAKIAQWMPLIFLFIFYNFAAALSLYYVINNCVSIIQIYRNLKKPLPELKIIPRKKKA